MPTAPNRNSGTTENSSEAMLQTNTTFLMPVALSNSNKAITPSKTIKIVRIPVNSGVKFAYPTGSILKYEYTCGEIVKTLRDMDFASVQEQGYIPLYKRDKLTDALHNVCGFRTDYEFITKQDMKTIQKKSKNR